MLLLIRSFLENRKQRRLLNAKASTWGNTFVGVPQGPVLGSMLFLIYINDLPENIKCNMKLFTDDTSLFTVVYDSHRSADELNRDLRSIEDWTYK